MDAPHHLAKAALFVYPGHARVHVEYIRARFRLLHGARRDIAHVAFEERFFHRLFARGIYAFADDAHPIERHEAGGTANRGGDSDPPSEGLFPLDELFERGDMLRRRPAAAAQDVHAHIEIFPVQGGKRLG